MGVWTISTDSLLPVSIDGIESPAMLPGFNGIGWTAVWRDHDRDDVISLGPATPFTPFTLIRYGSPLQSLVSQPKMGGTTLWLVGRASTCAVGPSFDPTVAATHLGGWTGPGPTLTVQVSVLGIPRRVELPLRFEPVQPDRATCP